MDGRDTVIGVQALQACLSRKQEAGSVCVCVCVLSQTRPGLQRQRETNKKGGKGELRSDVPQPKTHVGGSIRRHGSNVS